MDRETVISVQNVSMRFNLASEKVDSIKEYFVKRVKRQIRMDEFYALKGVDLEVKKGDAFAIVGENGCGKSTLLKIISGIYYPSKGSVKTNGTIAPLIELGAGFDMDLTARENIFLNGSVLGYSRAFMEEKFQEIMDFAELWDFVDVPVKNFSSGMIARLGFSIATMVVPDILIVDEILAVGDFMFQRKCEEKIQSMLEQGTTLIFVSHSTEQVKSLCSRAVWIDHGVVQKIGSAVEVCDAYVACKEGGEPLPVPAEPAESAAAEPEPPADALPEQPERRRFVFLDWVRVLAALMVVYSHVVPYGLKGLGASWGPMQFVERFLINPFGIVEDFGYLGMCLFFLCAGFALAQSAGIHRGGKFAARRLLGVYLPLIAATVFLFLFQLLMQVLTGGPTYWAQFSLWDWVRSGLLLTYFMGENDAVFGTTWFLVPLLLFCFWCWVLLPLARKRQKAFVVVMLVIGLLNVAVLPQLGPYALNLARLQSYIVIALLGQILCWAYTGQLPLRWSAGCGAAAAVLCFWSVAVFYPESVAAGGALRCVNLLYAFGIFGAAMVLEKRLPKGRAIRVLAAGSMAVYLCHMQITQLLQPWLMPRVGVTWVVVITCCVIAAAAALQTAAVRLPGRMSRGRAKEKRI